MAKLTGAKGTETDLADVNELNKQLLESREKADRLESELKGLKTQGEQGGGRAAANEASPGTKGNSATRVEEPDSGLAELRKDSMMAHLLDSLEAGKDIGHYGRLVFAMVARHFLSEGEVIAWLRRDQDFSEEAATVMMRQVEERDYNPPRRDRIVAWHKEQAFPILPDAEDPDCGNLYRNLKFPDHVYENIEGYREEKQAAE